ncbi:hypothetical protein [Comamonas endophytica]|uniref:Uncharacterized protein n=2 Tax=Comamonas endophytica TaxID=2949090 RepID=A0ABY6GFX0_9BURK|nr:hypothetical protein [Acidovorax sp. 5MLIR]UYG53796.1 hypothetical protein M9799_17835 [Acidovorax sp. 5MLIR]
MTKPVRHHKQYKLVSDFKKLVADAKHTFKELADGPAFKDFRAELRHTEHELKHNAAEVKAAVKDAAREIKAAFKNTDAHLKHLPAEPASPGELHTTPIELEPARIVCDRGRLPEPEPEPLDVTLVGLQSCETATAPALA